ncbi:hypothetical protein IFM89_034453 [Coptis chinensis]|uniref:Uncharacterized protein n=1 Tax=Coptis chinensis TaxID=261450 RepID=A0A835J001_9MAGN|nr:hypothetical protein IFM89_034453 [Coptis chinensis]
MQRMPYSCSTSEIAIARRAILASCCDHPKTWLAADGKQNDAKRIRKMTDRGREDTKLHLPGRVLLNAIFLNWTLAVGTLVLNGQPVSISTPPNGLYPSLLNLTLSRPNGLYWPKLLIGPAHNPSGLSFTAF